MLNLKEKTQKCGKFNFMIVKMSNVEGIFGYFWYFIKIIGLFSKKVCDFSKNDFLKKARHFFNNVGGFFKTFLVKSFQKGTYSNPYQLFKDETTQDIF